jgi:endonuclease/exonuclease/phosphatase family metal-dependent hydrolase
VAAKALPAVAACSFLLLSCLTGAPRLQQAAPSSPAPAAHPPEEQFCLLSWNLGFGGLGQGAEFCPDGGHRLIPSSKREVRANLAGIASALSLWQVDAFLFQEAALPSTVNHRLDLRAELTRCLPSYWRSYSPAVQVRFPGVVVDIGQATFSRLAPETVERVELPSERGGSLVRQRQHLLVSRFALPGSGRQLVLANVHLSAFDEGAQARHRQLSAVAAFMQAEEARGNYVVLGGDWNLVLADSRFAYTTKERYLFWVHPLPEGFPPQGWRKAVDLRTPTVRTLERPYVPGGNFTTIIDGFFLSPGVTPVCVRTIDLGFRYSDHQPVLLRFRLE